VQHVESPSGRVFRCASCAAFTYDVQGLSEEEVRRLVLETEGRVLTRLVSRRDGRVMSFDCGHQTVRPSGARWRLGVLIVLLAVLALLSQTMVHRDAADVPTPTPVIDVAPPAVVEIPPVVVPEPPAVVVPEPAPVDATAPHTPEVHLADVQVIWDKRMMSPAEAVGVLEQHLAGVRSCYAKSLQVAPAFRTSIPVSVRFENGVARSVTLIEKSPGGERVKGARLPTKVDHGTGHPQYEVLKACVRRELNGLTFEHAGGGTLWFRLVFDAW
jgi:hypothetical protein